MDELPQPHKLTDECFSQYIHLIHNCTRITISPNRKNMLESRLRKRMSHLKFNHHEEYLAYLKSHPDEKKIFINLITTNETSFFRTARIWHYLEKQFLPSWHEANFNTTLRIWSAAAASGEEALSLAIICEEFRTHHLHFTYQIIGTDISEEMISLCKNGRYSGRSLELFKKQKPELFYKYMTQTKEGDYEASMVLRNHLRFQQHNLFEAFKVTVKFDLVLLRNVLIYFSRPDQEEVLNILRPALKDEALLIIGESETLSHIATPFKIIEPLIYRINTSQLDTKV